MAALDHWFVALVQANPQLRVRIGNPDELASNKMGTTLALLKHRVNVPEPGVADSLDGAVNSVAGLDFWLRAASESRPITGLDRWTPVTSVKLGITGWFLDALYRAAVGGVAPSTSADSP